MSKSMANEKKTNFETALQNFEREVQPLAETGGDGRAPATSEKSNSSFDEFKSFESDVGDLISLSKAVRSEATEQSRFYENLLESSIDAISTALSLRDDGMELSQRYLTEHSQRLADKELLKLSRARWSEGGSGSLDIEAEEAFLAGLKDAVNATENEDQTGLVGIERAKLFAQISQAELRLAAKRAEKTSSIRSFDILEAVNTLLLERSSTDGGALNYRQRRDLLKASFDQLVVEAYWRLKSVERGISVSYPQLRWQDGRSPEPIANLNTRFLQKFPEPQKGVGYVDKLLRWARHTAYVLQRIRKLEQTIVVKELILGDDYRGIAPPEDPKIDWKDKLDRSVFFSFPSPGEPRDNSEGRIDGVSHILKNNVDSVRLLSLKFQFEEAHAGHHYDKTNPDQVVSEHLVWSATVASPPQKFGATNRGVNKIIGSIPDIRTGKSSLDHGDWWNVDPRGLWTFNLEKFNSYGTTTDKFVPRRIFAEFTLAVVPKGKT